MIIVPPIIKAEKVIGSRVSGEVRNSEKCVINESLDLNVARFVVLIIVEFATKMSSNWLSVHTYPRNGRFDLFNGENSTVISL